MMSEPFPDALYMQQALDLAVRGIGRVEPNPIVGAVVLDADGEVCGVGWHKQFGGPHAEVYALQEAGPRTAGGTLYVTLEPCSHHGKTPPCAEAVIAAGLKRVVIGCSDPAPHVAGRGIEMLRAAGITVDVGVMQQASEDLIAPFRTLMLEKRPWVHAKWAMSLDGRIATHTGHSQWISNARSRAFVHELRGRMDGILVGSGTALADDPQLTPRPPGPRTPLRIVLDARGRLPLSGQLAQTARDIPVLLFTSPELPVPREQEFLDLGIQVQRVPVDDAGQLVVANVLQHLGTRQLTHLLVEGGSHVLGSFRDAGLIDEVHLFVAPKLIGGRSAISPFAGTGAETVPELPTLRTVESRMLENDVYIHGRVAR